jgi:hypothetical protein
MHCGERSGGSLTGLGGFSSLHLWGVSSKKGTVIQQEAFLISGVSLLPAVQAR